jgi:hypothetical protein
MWLVGVVLACAAAAQQSPLTDGLTPYQFTFSNRDADLYAFVNEADLQKISIPVVIDEPWNKRVLTTTVQRSFIAEMSEELSATRKARLKREWEAAGGVEVRDRSGNPYWVLESDVRKQARMEQMTAEAFPQVVEAKPVDASPAGELHEGGANGPGFIRLWGMHIAVAAGALALMGLAAWFTFRRSWSPA